MFLILSAPEIPSIVQAYSKRSNSITVEFGNVSSATTYILRAENNDGFFSEIVVYGSPGFIPNLRPYTDYTLSVMSRNSGGHSQPSCPVNTRTGRLIMHSDLQSFCFLFHSGHGMTFLNVARFLYSHIKYCNILVCCDAGNYCTHACFVLC